MPPRIAFYSYPLFNGTKETNMVNYTRGLTLFQNPVFEANAFKIVIT